MAEYCHEEGIVPTGALDFAPYGCVIGVSSQDVEGKPAQNGEVLRSVVLSRAIDVLVEMDVEHPMEFVLDGPMAAGDLQQPLWGRVFGQEIVAYKRRVGALASQVSARSDPAHRSDTWKAVDRIQAGIAHDGRAPRFAPIVSGAVDLLGAAALARSRKLLRNRLEQGSTIGFDRQNIVAATVEHRARKGAVAMERIGGNDAALEAQKIQHLQGTRRLVAAKIG